jgi:hypothetical protein
LCLWVVDLIFLNPRRADRTAGPNSHSSFPALPQGADASLLARLHLILLWLSVCPFPSSSDLAFRFADLPFAVDSKDLALNLLIPDILHNFLA